jgi:rod shape-determining protein MreC
MTGLFIIALLLIMVHKVDLGIVSGVSKGIFYITAPLIRIITLPAEGISYSYKKLSEIINVYNENTRLKKQNEELFMLKDKLRAIQAENKSLKDLLHHIAIPNAKSYTAKIIAENGNAFSNSYIVYLGDFADKIKTGYAVVDKNGLIGRIDLISGKYARVTLITDISSKIPVISQKSRERGILVGNNTKELTLIFTPLLAELHKGDLLVTSGVGGGLPADIPIARIKKVDVDKITAVPLFNPTKTELIKIIAYDVNPDKQTAKELE